VPEQFDLEKIGGVVGTPIPRSPAQDEFGRLLRLLGGQMDLGTGQLLNSLVGIIHVIRSPENQADFCGPQAYATDWLYDPAQARKRPTLWGWTCFHSH
jgi:hypothetical protein